MADGDRHDFDTEAPTAERPSRRVADPLIGFTINEVYEIRERIDAGGMGVVYLAWDRGLHRFVAVKTLRSQALAESGGAGSVKEAARQARIDHPAFVSVMHAATFRHPDGERSAFFVMEYVKGGETLLSHARAKGLDQTARLKLFAHLCEAVQHLHEREGLIHFDLKNANVLVDDRGRVRVIDLGVARALRESAVEIPGGTVTHMSPEHMRGRVADLDQRCDVWSLGVMLYMLLSDGEAPFKARASNGETDRIELLSRAICEDEPARLEVDDDLWRIVERALAKAPADRSASVGAMLADVRVIIGEPQSKTSEALLVSVKSRRRVMAGRSALAACIAVVSVLIAIPLTPLLTLEWTDAQGAFGRWLLQPAQVGPEAPLGQVAIIAFTDDTDVEALADASGIDGVSADRVVSHRRLHGELSRLLADSGARAVVFDIVFRSETEFDDSFADGIRALRDAGVGVVIATPQWQVDETTGQPIMSGRLWREDVHWGCYALQELGGQLVVPLVVRRGETIMPSLPMAAFAASRADGGAATFELHDASAVVEVHYWKSDPAQPDARQSAAPSDRIQLTAADIFDPTIPRVGSSMGYREGDVIGEYYASTLKRSAMEAVTHSYEDVFFAGESTRRQWFANKVVMIGNASQAGRDLHPVGDDIWPGVFLQAAATESLLRRHRTRAPHDAAMFGIAGVSALFAALCGMQWAGAPRRRAWTRLWWSGASWILISTIGLAVLIMVSFLSYRSSALFWSPFLPAAAATIAAAGGVLAAAIVAARIPSLHPNGHQGDVQ